MVSSIMPRPRCLLALCCVMASGSALAQAPESSGPAGRVLLDAHNCYPYNGRWADRIERALATGMPLAIEQDLFWYTDKQTGRSWSIVSHGNPADGSEPTLRDYFLERIRPVMEHALKEDDR